MTEIYLHRDDLVKIIELIDEVNPEGTLRLQAGIVKIEYDNSSGIGAEVHASVPMEYKAGKFGDLRVRISSVENW